MRIAIVVYGGLDRSSGGYLYDRRLVDALRARGHRVDCIVQGERPYFARLLDNLAPPDFLGYDAVILDEMNHASLLSANAKSRRIDGTRRIALVHHLLSDEGKGLSFVHRALERGFLTTVDGFVFNSGATRRRVEALIGGALASERFVVATPGSDRFEAPPRGFATPMQARDSGRSALGEGRLELLFVGNLIPRKNLRLAIEALSLVPQLRSTAAAGQGGMVKGVRLTVVGGETDAAYARRERRRAFRALGPGIEISFVGGVGDLELERLYRSSDLLLVPSFYEGFGIVYLEAMRFGVVPIASNMGGAAEIIEDGVSGYLVDPRDPKALAAIIARLATDPLPLSAMSAAARDREATFPGWEESMEGACVFIEGLARR